MLWGREPYRKRPLRGRERRLAQEEIGVVLGVHVHGGVGPLGQVNRVVLGQVVEAVVVIAVDVVIIILEVVARLHVLLAVGVLESVVVKVGGQRGIGVVYLVQNSLGWFGADAGVVHLTGHFGELSHFLEEFHGADALAIVAGSDHHHAVQFLAYLYDNLVPQ